MSIKGFKINDKIEKIDYESLDNKPSYTGEEIDEKLSKIDELENKIDSMELVAGDFIEIKDGVVRCTFGDVISGELKEEVDEVFGVDSIPEMEILSPDGYPSVYGYGTDSIDKFPKLNEKLTIEFTKSDGTKKTFEVVVEGEVDESYGEIWAYYNCEEIEVGKDYVLTKIDENSDAICMFICYSNDEEDPFTDFGIQTFEDFTGASLFVGYKTITDTREYALLPDNALGLGREIVTETSEEIFSSKDIAMENMETVYMAMFENTYGNVSIGNILEVNITPPNEDTPTTLTSEVVELDLGGGLFVPVVYCNCIMSIDADTGAVVVTKIDDTIPAVVVVFSFDDGNPVIQLTSADNYTSSSIVINNKIITKTNVKLPNEALSFDIEPTEGSKNLVNSGDLYNVIGDIKTVVAQINTLVGGVS